VRKEMELAKAELREKGKAAGLGAGMFGGAGLVALHAVGALTACAIQSGFDRAHYSARGRSAGCLDSPSPVFPRAGS
jgi:hypothetical protein